MYDVMPPIRAVWSEPAAARLADVGAARVPPAAASPLAPRPAAILPPGPLLARLIEDASRACRRDGVGVSPAALAARIGARIGMPAEQVMRRLARCAAADAVPRPSPLAAPLVPRDNVTLWRHLGPLAEEILGEPERQAFFSRCLNEPEAPRAGGGALAAVLTARRWQTAVSARRKMAVALARLGCDRFPD